MKILKSSLVLSAAVLCAGTAEAKKNWSVWVQCDGYSKPEPGGLKLAKGLATISTLGLFGIPEGSNPEGRAQGAAGVNACNAALSDPALEGASDARLVRLRQALAIHHLEAGNPAEALKAIDAARSGAEKIATNPFFQRSSGLSLSFVRAAALLRMNRGDEALAEVEAAAAIRPYSARTQMLALGLMALDTSTQAGEMPIAQRLAALDPSSNDMAAAVYLRKGRYSEAWQLFKRGYEAEKSSPPKAENFLSLTDRGMGKALIMAFTAARAGDTASAADILDRQKASMALAAEQLGKMKLRLKSVGDIAGEGIEAQLQKPIEVWRPVVESAALIAKGDALAAQEKLIGQKEWGASPLLVDLAADIRSKLPPESRKGLIAIDPAELRAKIEGSRESRVEKLAGADLFKMLPEPEDEKRLNSYSKQAGWGLKPTGFKQKKLEDGRTRIQFVGSSSSPLAVEEMTLLRAADLALEKGHAGFTIEKRGDYTRMSQMTMNGMPVGAQTLAGYQTEVEVRFVDQLQSGDIDAKAVVAALKPIYVRLKETAQDGRSKGD